MPVVLLVVLVAWPVTPAAGESLSEVFRRVNPSVVVIRTQEREVAASGQVQPTAVAGVGSGVLITPDGKVMTAAHVVHTADEVTVEFLSGDAVKARVIGSEPDADVSLLQLERVPAGVRPAGLGDSDAVQVGDQVFIVGAPYGIGHSLTVGHVSARHKPNTVYSGMALAEFLQTDAAINQGNSGGPMFDMRGEMIGIVSHIISKSGGFEGLGFVVTSNMARRLLLEQRSFWSGVQGFLLRGPLARVFNVPQAVGMLVQKVARDSPAARVGLKGGTMKATIEGQTLLVGGDIILAVGGVRLGDADAPQRIRALRAQLRPGETLTVVVLRGGRRLELTARGDDSPQGPGR